MAGAVRRRRSIARLHRTRQLGAGSCDEATIFGRDRRYVRGACAGKAQKLRGPGHPLIAAPRYVDGLSVVFVTSGTGWASAAHTTGLSTHSSHAVRQLPRQCRLRSFPTAPCMEIGGDMLSSEGGTGYLSPCRWPPVAQVRCFRPRCTSAFTKSRH